jgi:hypothetical protein
VRAVVDDLYGTLGVGSSATTDEIAVAFRARAKELHPDRHPGDTAVAEQFKALTHAYNVLARPDRRAAYDHRRVASRATPVAAPAHEPVFRTPGRARAAIWAGIALVVLGIGSGVLLAGLQTGDSTKTITLWIVVAKLIVCGALLWAFGAWRLHRLQAGHR